MYKKTVTARFLLFLALLALLAVVLTSCLPGGHEKPSEKHRLKVAATIFPLADIAGCIGGEKIDVITLLPPGASPHTFEVTPKQAKSCSDVDIYIKVGAGVDDWIDRLAAVSPDTPLVITVTEEVKLARNGDPHIWLDPVIVKEYIAPQICREMIELLPDQQDSFLHNLMLFENKLDVLHEEILSCLVQPEEKRIISFHSCWGYFCDRYGIEEVASIEEYPGKEPSVAWLADVIEKAKTNNVQAIFAEPQFNPKAAEVIAGEFGGRVVFPDPIGGAEIQGRDSYINLMSYNAEVFADAFKTKQGSERR